jgi:integrase
VLTWMGKNTPRGVLNYFKTAFSTGMRPEELIALLWQDIDFRRNEVSVRRAFSAGELKPTKTYEERTINLNARSREALVDQHKLTGTGEYVFLNPVTDRPWASEKSQREHYWKPHSDEAPPNGYDADGMEGDSPSS